MTIGCVTTYLCSDDVFLQHRPPGEHPECPERLSAITRAIEAADLSAVGPGKLRRIPPRPATRDELLRVHSDEYLWDLEKRMGPNAPQPVGGWLDPDTYYGPGSWEAAMNAAGSATDLALRILASQNDNGFALVRPPGHHACRSRAMGFCLINNIAVAAAAAKAKGAKVAIVDIDVHHGNGTEEIFYGDPGLLFISTHQYPFYPGTGAATETGDGAAAGMTLNIPLPEGAAGPDYRLAFRKLVLPALRRFAPDLILVSAGFDGHARDPLAGMALREQDYADLVAQLLHVQPRLLLVLEGGYGLEGLSQSVVTVLTTLLSGSAPPLQSGGDIHDGTRSTVSFLQRLHHL